MRNLGLREHASTQTHTNKSIVIDLKKEERKKEKEEELRRNLLFAAVFQFQLPVFRLLLMLFRISFFFSPYFHTDSMCDNMSVSSCEM